MGNSIITPDSFYDGGKYKSETDIIAQVNTMLDNGATFIDVGAYSSRPGADHVVRRRVDKNYSIAKKLIAQRPSRHPFIYRHL